MPTKLIKPTPELVKHYLTKFEVDHRYRDADIAISKLMAKFPLNTNLEEILLKVCTINQLYSTNIYDTYKMAKSIQGKNIDKCLLAGELDLVREIAINHGIINKKTNKEYTFYSFATKYCSWHKLETYPIYDGFVEKLLMRYKRETNFHKFKGSDLKDYKQFKQIIDAFMKHFELSEFSLKQIDKFLWIYGKEVS